MTYTDYLNKLIAGTDLSADETTDVMDQLMDGELTPAQVAAFITALRIKGETTDEISAAALSMRRHATRIPPVQNPRTIARRRRNRT